MPWDRTNPLYRWKMRQRTKRKLNKSKSVPISQKVKHMPRRKRSRIRRAVSYPRRRFRRFRKGKAPIPVLPMIGGVVAPVAISLQKSNFLTDIQSDPMKATTGLIDQLCQRYTGLSPLYGNPWSLQPVIETYTGLFAGIVGHKLANKFGINRYMKRVPFLGKYIQL